jgi:hypothetical protein
MLAGLLAFAFLDRFTGSWSVNDMDWFTTIRDLLIKDNYFVWFGVSLVRGVGRWHPCRAANSRNGRSV